ncbi:toll-like receptor 2 [Pelobates fuscus]|uniref:toll-like receptor 2 n=1 Tax=Pelobates fuscus TaxID=191477 RepID=UPI002FE4B41D
MLHFIYRSCIFCSLVTSLVLEEVAGCVCNANHFCDCSSMGLKSIPPNLPKGMIGLDLSNNKIQVLTGSDLNAYNKLEILHLTWNEIQTISDDTFDSLRNLKDMDLSYNKLKNLSPTWFRNLHMLKYLNLLGNLYPTLGISSLFSSLSSLTSLKFGNQYLSDLKLENLKGLERLDEVHIHFPNLKEYAKGSLKEIQHINYIILTMNINLAPDILNDLVYSVTLFEIRNMSLLLPEDVTGFSLFTETSVRKLIFKNCTITDKSTARLLEIMQHYKNITDLILEDSELLGTGQGYPLLKDDKNSLTTIIIRNLQIPNFYLFSDLSFAYILVKHIKSITCTGTNVFLIPCNFSRSFLSMEYLDVSENLLTDIFLASSACFLDGGGAWPLLKTLNVSKNLLTKLPDVAHLLSSQPYLINLDLSQNKFGESSLSECKWAPTLKYLNLSSCQLKEIHLCIPTTLEILDISSNYLTTFVAKMPDLKVLYVSNNRMSKLPGNAHLPSLGLLIIRANKLIGFFKSDLEVFLKLTGLDGRDNSYDCSCEFLDYIKSHSEILLGWPENYICDSPSSVRNLKIQDAQLSIVKCHKTLFVTVSCIILIVVIAIIVALCHFLHVIWYVKMTYAWLKAKRKPLKVSEREICYNAFVSYSEMDSEWVENMMAQELENSAPSLKLCLHKRDFVPGKWIIDNIIDAMEKSYKTLFILSENFVQSEWCKYELEFSHFRLLDENNDTAILILLEPIEKESMPKRFYKLRKLMNTKTYMEWPADEEEQKLFWENLRTILQIEYADA